MNRHIHQDFSSLWLEAPHGTVAGMETGKEVPFGAHELSSSIPDKETDAKNQTRIHTDFFMSATRFISLSCD